MTVLHRTDSPQRYEAHVAGNRYIVTRQRNRWRINLPGEPRFRPVVKSSLAECREWFDRVAAAEKASRPPVDHTPPADPFDGLV